MSRLLNTYVDLTSADNDLLEQVQNAEKSKLSENQIFDLDAYAEEQQTSETINILMEQKTTEPHVEIIADGDGRENDVYDMKQPITSFESYMDQNENDASAVSQKISQLEAELEHTKIVAAQEIQKTRNIERAKTRELERKISEIEILLQQYEGKSKNKKNNIKQSRKVASVVGVSALGLAGLGLASTVLGVLKLGKTKK